MFSIDPYKRANILISSTLGNNNFKLCFIKMNETPRISISQRVIYCQKFGNLDHDDYMIVFGNCIHENLHGFLTPCDPDPSWKKFKCKLVNILEDLRIEYIGGTILPGISSILFESNSAILRRNNKNTIEAVDKIKEMSPVSQAIYFLFIESMGLPVDRDLSNTETNVVYDLIAPVFKKWSSVPNVDNKNGYYEIIKLADEIIELLKEHLKNPPQLPQNIPEEGDQDKEDQDKEYEDKQGESSEKPEEDSGSDNSESSEGESEEESDEDDEKDNQGSSFPDLEDEDLPTSSKPSAVNTTEEEPSEEEQEEPDLDELTKNDEDPFKDLKVQTLTDISVESVSGDGNYSAYKMDDTEIVPAINASSKEKYEKFYSLISSQTSHMSSFLKNRLMAKTKSRTVYHREDGILDKRRFLHASKALSKGVFKKVTKGDELDTCVGFIIDESGSMSNSYSYVASVLICLTECLNQIKIPYMALGSTCDYATNCPDDNYVRTKRMVVYRYKNFSEDHNLIKYRYGNIYCRDNFADGELIDLTCLEMSKRREKRKIIFTLTDGEPDCGATNNKRRIPCNYLSLAVKRAIASGFEVYGFGIGTRAPEAYYGKNNFIYLPTGKELGTSLVTQMCDVLVK